MIKNILTCILAVVAMTVMLASCGKRVPEYVIGVSQCSDDVWREKLNDELRIAVFAHDNVRLEILSANDDADLQIRQVDNFVRRKVDLLIVAPVEAKVTKAIDRAYDAGIPVIVFDRRTRSDKYTAYIGGDNAGMGRNLARYLTSQTRGVARVLEICDLSSSSPTADMMEGYDSEAARHNNITIVCHVESDWTEHDA